MDHEPPIWLLSHPCQTLLAEAIAKESAKTTGQRRVIFKNIIKWATFEDGYPNLFIENVKAMAGMDVVFLASFHDPALVFEQISIMQFIPRYHAKSLCICLPFFVCATMERVDSEGQIATAKVVANLLSTVPLSRTGPTELVVYDIHALQERFYFGDHIVPRLETALPLLTKVLKQSMTDEAGGHKKAPLAIAFPDDGARKRFGSMFSMNPADHRRMSNADEDADCVPLAVSQIIVCSKDRQDLHRIVSVREGNPLGHHAIIIDDLVISGGTLIECAKALKKAGAVRISCYVTHAVFPNNTWQKFTDAENCPVDRFWITDSLPNALEIAKHPPFEVLSLAPRIARLITSL